MIPQFKSPAGGPAPEVSVYDPGHLAACREVRERVEDDRPHFRIFSKKPSILTAWLLEFAFRPVRPYIGLSGGSSAPSQVAPSDSDSFLLDLGSWARTYQCLLWERRTVSWSYQEEHGLPASGPTSFTTQKLEGPAMLGH